MDAVRALIAAGCDLNLAKNDGATPVFAAAEMGYTVVVEALAAAGCDVNQADEVGMTPLMVSVCFNNRDIAVALLKHGADTALATSKAFGGVTAGSTALSVARQLGRNAIVELLTKHRRRRKGGKRGAR